MRTATGILWPFLFERMSSPMDRFESHLVSLEGKAAVCTSISTQERLPGFDPLTFCSSLLRSSALNFCAASNSLCASALRPAALYARPSNT